MSAENSQDQAINRQAIVASYTPEMLSLKDRLVSRLAGTKDQVAGLDAAEQLPAALTLSRYEGSDLVQITFGDLPKDFSEAMAVRRTEKLLADLAIEGPTGDSLGSDLMVITYNESGGDTENELFPDLAQPLYKMEWGRQTGDTTTTNSLSIYKDGYMESQVEATRREAFHPEGTDPFLAANMTPTQTREVDIVPKEIYATAIDDVQNAAVQLNLMALKYGLR